MKIEISDSEFEKPGTPQQTLADIQMIAAEPIRAIVCEMAKKHPGLCNEWIHVNFQLETDTGSKTHETGRIAIHVRPS